MVLCCPKFIGKSNEVDVVENTTDLLKKEKRESVVKRLAMKGLAGFLGLNLLVAVPLAAVILLCLPQSVEVDVIGDGVVAVAITDAKRKDGTANYCSSAELYDQSRPGATIRTFAGRFPRGLDFSNPSFFLRAASATNLTIRGVRQTVCGLFSRTLSPDAIAEAYRLEGTDSVRLAAGGGVSLPLSGGCCHLQSVARPQWCGLTLSPPGDTSGIWFVALFIGAELVLMAASLVVSFRRRRDKPGRLYLRQSVLLAAIAVFIVFVVVPLQSYFTNAADYPFGATRLLVDVAPCIVVGFATVLSGLCLSEMVFGRVPHFAMFAFLVYEYLEVGVLSIGAPSFIGEMSYYDDVWLMQRDMLVFEFVFIAAFVLYARLRKYFVWMLLALLVMTTAALLDVGMDRRCPGKAGVWTELDCVREEVPFEVRYSTNRNVVVLVLDSVLSEAARDVARKDSRLGGSFDGFRAFDKNLGVQYQTDISTVNIFTGECYRGRDVKSEVRRFMPKAMESGSVLLDYMDSGMEVYVMAPTWVFGRGFASPHGRRERGGIDQPTVENAFLWRPGGMFSTSVLSLSLFRMTPFILKPQMCVWVSSSFGFAEEAYVYPEFRSAPVIDSRGSFLYCHTEGAHVPHDVSADGVRILYGTNLDHVKSVFIELARTLDAYKEKGIYDCSTILVVADHGSHVDADARRLERGVNSLPAVAFPMLWVKPANSRGPIVFDEKTPTTHANLHKVLKALKDSDLTAEEIASMLSSDRRTFIRQTRDGYDEWIVKPDGSVESFSHQVVK